MALAPLLPMIVGFIFGAIVFLLTSSIIAGLVVGFGLAALISFTAYHNPPHE